MPSTPELEEELNLGETVGRFGRFASRRRWWITSTAFIVTAAAVAVVMALPNKYSSEATLVVVQQQVSQDYVTPSSTVSVSEVVQTMKREILSRESLMAMIAEFGLYPADRTKLSSGELTDLMRKDVDIYPLDPGPNLTAFTVSFSADNPRTAQSVTDRLTQLFIAGNSRRREGQANTQSNFVSRQVEEAKQKVDDQEERIRQFKSSHGGELPEQQMSNLSAMAELRGRLANVRSNLTRIQQQRDTWARSLVSSLNKLRSERSVLLETYTARHALVIRKEQDIAQIEKLAASLQADGASPSGLDLSDPGLSLIASQAEASAAERVSLQAEEQRVQAEIATYDARINRAPVHEQQLATLNRDSDLLRQQYADLMNKQMQSAMTVDMESRDEGQHFRLVDRATLPAVPVSPKRVKISLGAAGAGLVLGIMLAFLIDSRDRSFHDESELKRRFALPLVVGIPMLLGPVEQRRRNRKNAFEWCAVVMLTAGIVALEMYVYRYK